MSSFQVTPEYVSTAATSCNTTADTIQQQLAALQSYVESMNDMWHGVASQTFQELMTQYSTYSAMLYNALTDIGSGLNGNYVNYTDTEQANLKTISSIATQLQGTNFT
jgi:WXG100 family type VII secretion target